jgi:adenosine deaminase
LWQVERIDHGIRSLEDPELLDHLRATQLPLTLCPFSNIKVRRLPCDTVQRLQEAGRHALQCVP